MNKPIKRPLNVDLQCHLRVIGHERASLCFNSDEGDGYDIYPGYMKGEGPELLPRHYKEWADQLEYLVEWCRSKVVEAQKEFLSAAPAYVSIGGVALILKNDIEDRAYYYRHAGNWSVEFVIEKGKIYADCEDHAQLRHLHGEEMTPITEKVWRSQNEGYIY